MSSLKASTAPVIFLVLTCYHPRAHAQAGTTSLCSDLSTSPCASAFPVPAHPKWELTQKTGVPTPSVETSVSLGAFTQLTPTRLQTDAYYGFETGTQTQGIAPTAGVLGTFRQQFRPWLGYSVNAGYTRVDERYTQSSGGSDYHVPSNLYELSLSYVAEKHLTPRLDAFADLGAGFVTVLPFPRSAFAYDALSVNYRPQGVAGFGVDLSLTHNLAFRVEYRGLLYKDPDFGLGLQKSTTLTSEPTLSLVYRFGAKHKQVPTPPSQP